MVISLVSGDKSRRVFHGGHAPYNPTGCAISRLLYQ
ncbi:hypothetical protein CRJUMX01_520067 [Escherichia coli]|nr:hypothetical protein CRJUMX01_520067 [Escherichia coli]